MNHTPPLSLDSVQIDSSHPFVTVITPRNGVDRSIAAVTALFGAHRAHFMHLLTTRGVVLFRGYDPLSPEAFHEFVEQGVQLPPWNAFNLKGLPAMVGNWLRRYSEGLVGGGDYRRYLGTHTVQLGPVEDAVQGPHVEGGGSPRRSRHLALCCFTPSEHLAETGMVDLHAVFQALPPERQAKYISAFNRFFYLTSRPLRWLDRLILKQSPVSVCQHLPDGRAQLASPVTPAVCAHPETGLPCLQPWAFARNTNRHVFEAALQSYPDRGIRHPCSNAEGTHFQWELCDDAGQPLPWHDDEQRELFDVVFKHAYLHVWQRGDIALIDNIRMGHWRMNGQQGQRKLVQVQVDCFDALAHRMSTSAMGQSLPQMPRGSGWQRAA